MGLYENALEALLKVHNQSQGRTKELLAREVCNSIKHAVYEAKQDIYDMIVVKATGAVRGSKIEKDAEVRIKKYYS